MLQHIKASISLCLLRFIKAWKIKGLGAGAGDGSARTT